MGKHWDWARQRTGIPVLELTGIVGCQEPNSHTRQGVLRQMQAPISVAELMAVNDAV